MADIKKIVVVTGATGAQGGSVVQHLHKDGRYHVRALTRKLDSPAAQDLKKKGIEVVEANLDDVKSLEKALNGAYGVFGVTNFWEHFYDGEIRQGKNLGEAAKAAGIKHLVWSTLDQSGIPHFDTKQVIGNHLTKIGVPTTHLYTAFYYENLFKWMTPQKDASTGQITWNFPYPADKQFPTYSVEDTGAYVLEALNHPEKWLGKEIRVASEFITPAKLIEVVKKVCGDKFSWNVVDLEQFRHSKNPAAEELYLNFKFFIANQEDSGLRDVKLTHTLYPSAQTWESYLKTHQSEWQKLLA